MKSCLLDKCLASLDGVADEIVVVDSFSTDATEEICKKYNVRFIKHEFEGYRDQKNFALNLPPIKIYFLLMLMKL